MKLFQRALTAPFHSFLAAQALHGQPFFVMADIAFILFQLDFSRMAALLPLLMAPAKVGDDTVQGLAFFQGLVAGPVKSLFGLVTADRIGFFHGNIFRQFCQQAGRFFLTAYQVLAALGQGLFLGRQFLLPRIMLAQLVIAVTDLFGQLGNGNLPLRQGLTALGRFGPGGVTGVLPLLDVGGRPRFHRRQCRFFLNQPGLHIGPVLFQFFHALVESGQGLTDVSQGLLFLAGLPAGLVRSLPGLAQPFFGLGQVPFSPFGLLAQVFAFGQQGFQALLAAAARFLQLLQQGPPADEGSFLIAGAAASQGTAGVELGAIEADDAQAMTVFPGYSRARIHGVGQEGLP